MYTLKDIFTLLEEGELSNLSIGQDGIEPTDYPKVMSAINAALIAIYTKFPISEKVLTIKQMVDKTFYKLSAANAVSKVGDEQGYIVDSPTEPFKEDIIRINAAFKEDGSNIAVNDENTAGSVFTPSYDTLQIPDPIAGSLIHLTYRARHASIPLDTSLVSEVVPIEIPDVLIEAFLAYVSHKFYAAMGNWDNAGGALNKYNTICNEVEFRNVLNNSDNFTNIKSDVNGWV